MDQAAGRRLDRAQERAGVLVREAVTGAADAAAVVAAVNDDYRRLKGGTR